MHLHKSCFSDPFHDKIAQLIFPRNPSIKKAKYQISEAHKEEKLNAVVLVNQNQNREASIQSLRKKCPNIHIMAFENNIGVACNLLKQLKPDLFLLELSVNKDSINELLGKFDDIIFITSVFELNLDKTSSCENISLIAYLSEHVHESSNELKPMKNGNNLRQCYFNYHRLMNTVKINTQSQNQSIVVNSQGCYEIITIANIIYLEKKEQNTIIHLVDSRQIVSQYSIGKLNAILKNHNFFINGNFTLNIDKVKAMSEDNNGIYMINNEIIPISKKRRIDFQVRVPLS